MCCQWYQQYPGLTVSVAGEQWRHLVDDSGTDSPLTVRRSPLCSRWRRGVAGTAGTAPPSIYCYMTEQCFQAAQHNKIVSCPLHGNLGPYFIGSADGFVQLAHIAPDSVGRLFLSCMHVCCVHACTFVCCSYWFPLLLTFPCCLHECMFGRCS